MSDPTTLHSGAPALPPSWPPPPPPPPPPPLPPAPPQGAPALAPVPGPALPPGLGQVALPALGRSGLTGPLVGASLNPQGPILRRGDQGPEVQALQAALRSVGGAPNLASLDGRLDKATDEALRQFQNMTGIEADGEAGPHTKSALAAAQMVMEAKHLLAQGGAEAQAQAAQRVLQADRHLRALPAGQGGPAWDCLRHLAQATGLPLPTRDPLGYPQDEEHNPYLLADDQTWNALPASNDGMGQGPSGAGLGQRTVEEARRLQAQGYKYPPNLGSAYYHKPFKVGCCADFAVDSWEKAGVKVGHLMSNASFTPTQRSWLMKQGAWGDKSTAAKPGDWVFFKNGRNNNPVNHVAVVTAVDSRGRPTRIIEAYSGNKPVRERDIRSGDNIVGYGLLDRVAARHRA